jgi:hypothetical protein
VYANIININTNITKYKEQSMVTTNLGVNDIYKEMFSQREQAASKREQLAEVTSLKNLIHSDVETIRSEFTDAISVDGIEEKIRDAEKNDLTSKDKEIIKHLRKVIETIDALTKVEYEGVINTKDGNVVDDKAKAEEPAPEGGSEEQLKSADGGVKEEPAAGGDDFNFDENA